MLVKEQGLWDPAWSRDTWSNLIPGLWRLQPPCSMRWFTGPLTGGGGAGRALQGGLAASGEEVTVTPGCLKRLEEWAQKPGLMQASIRLQRAPAWLPSMPGWVAAASADRELAADACLDNARRELPPPHGTVRHQHDVTHRNVSIEEGLLLALSRVRPWAPGANSCHLSPRTRAITPHAPATPACLAPRSGLMLL